MTALIVLFIAATWAGVQNALAGGGAFITLPSLMLTGMDARAANITSTVALFYRATRHRLHRSGGRGEPDRADDAKVIHQQLHRRWTWRAHSPRHTAVDLRPPRAMVGAVRNCAVRL